jgi:hypothetical protein
MINIDTNIEYFDIDIKELNIVFTPKEFIKDIIWDYSNIFIPFTNGKRYYVYQDLVFNIIEFYENNNYSYISISINNENKLVPKIEITNIKDDDKANILKLTSKIITNYINKKFSLWN